MQINRKFLPKSFGIMLAISKVGSMSFSFSMHHHCGLWLGLWLPSSSWNSRCWSSCSLSRNVTCLGNRSPWDQGVPSERVFYFGFAWKPVKGRKINVSKMPKVGNLKSKLWALSSLLITILLRCLVIHFCYNNLFQKYAFSFFWKRQINKIKVWVNNRLQLIITSLEWI